MKRLLFLMLPVTLCTAACGEVRKTAPHGVVALRGAGSTFANPLYQKWAEEYRKLHPEVVIEYQAVGSSKGVERFLAQTVDFGASDGAMTDEQMAQVQRGAQLIPTMGGAIAVVYNLPDVGAQLKFDREVLADVFLGKITNWDDPRIAATNAGVSLPARPISVVARQDGSGTTFAFTNHLAAVSAAWKAGPGVGYKVGWPASVMLAPGNEGVAARVQRTPGSIGYVEYGYASRLGLATAALQNKEGAFVAPSAESGLATLANVDLPENFRQFIPDPKGRDAYPIVTYTWLLLYRQYPDVQSGEALKQFVTWCLRDGQQFNEGLGFIRVPPKDAYEAARAVEAVKVGP